LTGPICHLLLKTHRLSVFRLNLFGYFAELQFRFVIRLPDRLVIGQSSVGNFYAHPLCEPFVDREIIHEQSPIRKLGNA